jgi:hypothetical protein
MSLVENLINQISTQGLSGISKPLGFDMDDDTFANLLEKQMNAGNEITTTNSVGQMGAPAGLIIEPLNAVDGIDHAEKVQDQMEALGENLFKETGINSAIEIKDMDFGDYFSNLLKTPNDNNSQFINFAKKQASNAYDVFSRGYVADMQDFVEDVTSMI